MTVTTAYSAASKANESDALGEESFAQRWLVMPKVLYFLLNMFVYAFHGLMTLYFEKELKMPLYMIGYASSVIASNFVGAMIWGQLADRTGKYKTIIVATSLLQTLVALLLLQSDWFPVSLWPRYTCVFTALFFFNFFLSAAFPLLDAQILGMLTANPRVSKEQFNNQRLFGAPGHLAATLLSLCIHQQYPNHGQFWFQISVSLAFILAVMFGVPDVKPVKGGHHGNHAKSEKIGGEPVAAVKRPALTLLANANFMFFMVFIGFSGIIRAISTNFQKIIAKAITGDEHVKNGPHPPPINYTKIACLDIPRTISEMGVYMTAKYMKEAFGVYWVLVFSQLVGIFRMWGYGLIEPTSKASFYYAIGFELMKGFNSGLISTSAIPIASSLAPAGCESTAQSLYSGNYSGLSMAFGGLIGGVILQYLYVDDAHQLQNCRTLFVWVSIAALVITVMLAAKYIFVDRVMGFPGFPRRHSFHK